MLLNQELLLRRRRLSAPVCTISLSDPQYEDLCERTSTTGATFLSVLLLCKLEEVFTRPPRKKTRTRTKKKLIKHNPSLWKPCDAKLI